jgi:hypothetical protein
MSETTRWFRYDRDYLYVNKSQFVPVIFEPPCIWPLVCQYLVLLIKCRTQTENRVLKTLFELEEEEAT